MAKLWELDVAMGERRREGRGPRGQRAEGLKASRPPGLQAEGQKDTEGRRKGGGRASSVERSAAAGWYSTGTAPQEADKGLHKKIQEAAAAAAADTAGPCPSFTPCFSTPDSDRTTMGDDMLVHGAWWPWHFVFIGSGAYLRNIIQGLGPE